MNYGIVTRPFLLALILAVSALAASPVKNALKAEPQKTAPEKTLLFFMNPNGWPCQRQLSILDGISDSLVPLARVIHVKTTNDEDLPKFRQYGIRGLPFLLITDKRGKEIYRFSPGIQPAETVLKALKK
ncbi:MAG: thioredoxin family protein [Fibrobacterota bacterium]